MVYGSIRSRFCIALAIESALLYSMIRRAHTSSQTVPAFATLFRSVEYKNAGRALAPALLEVCQETETSPGKVSNISN
jgi:hypothetical protein